MTDKQSPASILHRCAAELKAKGLDFGSNKPVQQAYNGWSLSSKIRKSALYRELWYDHALRAPSLWCGLSCYRAHKPIDDLITQSPTDLLPRVVVRSEDYEPIEANGKTWYALKGRDVASLFGQIVRDRQIADADGPPASFYGVYFRPHDFDAQRAANFIKRVLGSVEPVLENINEILHNEGQQLSLVLKRRSRSRSVRDECLGHYGYTCHGCDQDCSDFGNDLAGIIEVHHLDPIAIGTRETRPTDDCRPLCPTCHRMAHYGRPVNKPRSPDEIRQLRGLPKRGGA